MAIRPKTDKVQIYYPKATREGKHETLERHFIHKRDGGFWVSARDLTQREQVANGAKDIVNTVQFEANKQTRLISLWQDLFILFRGKHYKINAKPDEYDHVTGTIKINATQFVDNNEYTGDVYEV